MTRILKILLLLIISLQTVPIVIQADDSKVLNSKITFPKHKESVYYFLQYISEQSGYMFIYDSDLINNDRIIKLSKKEYTVHAAIRQIINNENIGIKVIDSYILLLPSKAEDKKLPSNIAKVKIEDKHTTLRGCVYNAENREQIPYCSIGIFNTTIGTVTNNEGEFQIILPDSLLDRNVVISHIGFEKREIIASIFSGKHLNFYLQPRTFSLSEAVINMVDPYKLLDSMRMNIYKNYQKEPAYITGFYREGIDYKNKHVDLTESILKIYKLSHDNKHGSDQAKLIKMRRINDRNINDSVIAIVKIQSGISACFMLDIIRNFPDFLEVNQSENTPYRYRYVGVSDIEDRKVYIISFEQNEFVTTPLFIGELYIDAENYALIEARFKINPKHIKEATESYIIRRHKNIRVELKKVEYIVSYKQSVDGRYYVNYVRGGLDFNIKNKKIIFSTNTPINIWFALTNCHIDTVDVHGFPKKERIAPNKIFSDNRYTYDPNFWEQFNVVLPEKELLQLIEKNINEVIIGELNLYN